MKHLKKLISSVDGKAFGTLLVLLILIGVLWDTGVVYPLKILVVFFHELSHGLAAIITGGEIVRIELSSMQGGVCYTRGGSRFLITTAGYLGSLLWGGTILMLAARTRFDRQMAAALGVMMLIIAVLFIRPFISFGMGFVLLTSLVLIGLGFKAPESVNDFLLRTIGLTSCLYAPLDIKSDILDRPHLRSDAVNLADHTGIPAMVWGIVWITIAVIVSAYFMLQASQSEVSLSKKDQSPPSI